MNLIEFLQDLSLKGVKFWSDEGKLRTGGSQEVLTTDVIAQLKQYKPEILELLKENPDIFQVYPLSYGQKGLWFLWQLSPQNHNYNLSFALRIYSKVDIIILQKVFQALRERHPLLRSTFPQLREQPIQKLHQSQELDFLQINASSWSEEELNKKVVEAHRHPFDLETSIMRVRWFTCSEANHVMLMTIHHIALDGWSYNLIAKELPELYQAQLTGIEASLPTLKHFYQDYVSWQKELVEGQKGEQLWKYWQQKLGGELPVLNLPTDRPRPPIQSDNGATYLFKLSEKLTEQLKELSQIEGATLYMTLLAAFQVLLYRYTGQENILVGSPTSGRTKTEFTSIVGYFVDSVVIGGDLSGNLSFRDFLSQVRQTVLGAIDHQDYPFALLVEKLNLERDLSRSPVFQACFLLQKFHEFQDVQKLFFIGKKTLTNWETLEVEAFSVYQYESQYDLYLEMVEEDSSLVALLKYNADLFDEQTIARMAGHFQNLLEGIVSAPQQIVTALPLMTELELDKILVEWNNTTTDYQKNKCIHQLFEEQVEKTPDAIAVVFEQQQLTYFELNCQANKLAHYLQSLGVKPEVLVGICLERSLLMIVGLLGILKAGGAYIPIDPTYPAARLSYLLEDAAVPVLLSTESVLSGLPKSSPQIVCLDRNWDTIDTYRIENLDSGVTQENLAYTIYTSGSTGKPKGCMNTHTGIYNRLLWMQETYQLTNRDRILQKTPFSFDVSVWEFFWPLFTGATLVVASPEIHKDSEAIIDLIIQQEITTIHFVPSMLSAFLQGSKIEECSSLKRVICSGEALSYQLQKRFQEKLKCELHNLYGPTEAAIDVTFIDCGTNKYPGIVPIGRPIANTQLYILDSNNQPVPIGVVGELHIGGAGLARGYLNRPELTAERFIPNPFDNNNSKVYKTGDLGRYLPDGNIEYIGRIDNQVKVRGYRIETGEIETTISQNSTVKETVVLPREDKSGNKVLVAYLVLKSETSEVSETEKIGKLKQYLKERLPEYMIPSRFVLLPQLPLTANGKVDRKALPKPDFASSLSREFVAPQTETQKRLAKIWAELLGIEKVGIHDNFFDFGGHSLLATQVMSRVRKAFALELSLQSLFDYPELASFAEEIESLLMIAQDVLQNVGESSVQKEDEERGEL